MCLIPIICSLCLEILLTFLFLLGGCYLIIANSLKIYLLEKARTSHENIILLFGSICLIFDIQCPCNPESVHAYSTGSFWEVYQGTS